MRIARRLLLAAAVSAATVSAQAALIDRPGGMVYDDVLDVTWLKDWNVNGAMNHGDAKAWAENLVYGGYDDWRLPTGDVGQAAGALNEFRSLWNTAGGTTAGLQSYFSNVQTGSYWSASDWWMDTSEAYFMYTGNGGESIMSKWREVSAVAVRSGDVAAAVVPEPHSWALALLALGAVSASRRRSVR